MGDGQFQIFADQCITIAGGANVDGGGLCINIVGTKVMLQYQQRRMVMFQLNDQIFLDG